MNTNLAYDDWAEKAREELIDGEKECLHNANNTMFYGIIVRMYAESGGKHNLPHIHAGFSGYEVVADLDGNVIEGEFPKGKMKLLLAWMEIHRDELEANWKLLCDREPAFKIEPLK